MGGANSAPSSRVCSRQFKHSRVRDENLLVVVIFGTDVGRGRSAGRRAKAVGSDDWAKSASWLETSLSCANVIIVVVIVSLFLLLLPKWPELPKVKQIEFAAAYCCSVCWPLKLC